MTAVRKAKYRFSTLRSRVMHRSASGSQVGDAMQAAREPSSLSVQLSGQCISPHLAHPCQLPDTSLWQEALVLMRCKVV